MRTGLLGMTLALLALQAGAAPLPLPGAPAAERSAAPSLALLCAAAEAGQSRLSASGSEADRAGAVPLWKAQFCPYGIGYYCYTPYGGCPLASPLCLGAPCFCPTVYGPVWGSVN